jgi:hypothetical protein
MAMNVSYPIAHEFLESPLEGGPMVVMELDENFTSPARGCLRSRAWCLIPVAAFAASTIAVGAAIVYVSDGRKSVEKTCVYAGLAAASITGAGILSVLGRSIFSRVKEGTAAACRELKSGFCAYLQPEGVGINSLLAALPPAFCLAVWCKARQERQQETHFATFEERL